MRCHEVAREILDIADVSGLTAMTRQEFLIGLRRRLGSSSAATMFEHRLEMRAMPSRASTLSHARRAVGQDQFASGKFGDRSPHLRVRLQRR